ncbi:expressed unknown protein [Seminavis robusta]|uniref:Uncharacterized protein n=1 Tax=Seminavis robusta TaxID=568900 RepID=A0A9N8HBU7_9STRA|nr:expressed unknown protein [Seminavis robusta]|eukprot:Sro379_g130390.1 n/a (275) ;mRNA; r:14997-15821
MSSESLSFGACYQGNCACLGYKECGERTCDCGHSRCFHAPHSLTAWKTLEYPAERLARVGVDTGTAVSHLTSALKKTTISRKSSSGASTASASTSTAGMTIPAVLQILYQEGHLTQLQKSPFFLSSLTHLVLFRCFRGDRRLATPIEAVLDLIDALWSRTIRTQAVHRSFPNESSMKTAFCELERMVLRAIQVLEHKQNNTASTRKKKKHMMTRRTTTDQLSLTGVGTMLQSTRPDLWNKPQQQPKKVATRNQKKHNKSQEETMQEANSTNPFS